MAKKRVYRRSKCTSKRRRKSRRGRRRQSVKPKLVIAMNKLKNMGASRRVAEISAAPDKLIRDMSSALHKARRHSVSLPKGLAKQVKKHAKSLRLLSNPRISVKKKRTLMKQKGGGILGTVARLIPIIGPIIGGLFGQS